MSNARSSTTVTVSRWNKGGDEGVGRGDGAVDPHRLCSGLPVMYGCDEGPWYGHRQESTRARPFGAGVSLTCIRALAGVIVVG